MRFVMGILTVVAHIGPAAAQDLVLANGNVVDVRTGITRVATVLVRDGIIVSVSPTLEAPGGAQIVDATGRWIVPGLVEMHTHSTEPLTLRRALALGVTSALVIYTGDDAERPSLDGPSQVPGVAMPRVYLVVGRFSGEFPGDLVPGAPPFAAPATPAQARAMLDSLRTEGIQRIKIWMDDVTAWVGDVEPMPVFGDEVFAALVRGARARGMAVYVHAWTADQYRRAVAFGPTWIIHPMMDEDLTAADVSAMRQAGLGWTATLAQAVGLGDPPRYARMLLADSRLSAVLEDDTRAYYQELGRASTNPAIEQRPRLAARLGAYVATIGRNARFVANRGLTLTVGSDRTIGYGTHLEIELMRDAGLDARTILRAATLGGAEALGVDGQFGAVEPGRVADLLLLASDPLVDILNLRDIAVIIKGGTPWRPVELLTPAR